MLQAAKKLIDEGDYLFLYGNKDTIFPIQATKGAKKHTEFGVFHHDDIIGKPYGQKVHSKSKNAGWMYMLPPTPELYTLCLQHRTQILYNVDISQVILELELKPGSIVVESGTGSGSLTTSLARAVHPHGQVFTFEFHAQRAEAAQQDFKVLGVADVVTVTNRDVCKEGFLVEGKLGSLGADAVFLDLPAPWEAVPKAKEVLKGGGMFCSFSPCIEQVQRCAAALSELAFEDIETMECLLRPYDVRTVEYEQVALDNTQPQQEPTTTTTTTSTQEGEQSQPSQKRKREQFVRQTSEVLVCKPHPFIRGHTGYLTFARKVDYGA